MRRSSLCSLIVWLLAVASRGSCLKPQVKPNQPLQNVPQNPLIPKITQTCRCGESNINKFGRIVNGVATTPNKYPWMAAMFNVKGSFMCGGSVISSKNILTAGHCLFYTSHPFGTSWVLGMHKVTSKTGVQYFTRQFAVHPNFVNGSFYDDFDLAIATVDRHISFNHNVQTICLPALVDQFVGVKAIVAGWGRLGERKHDPLATMLMETKVMVKSDQQCTAMTKHMVKFNPKSMVCAHEDKTDACQGDSGGPLFIETQPNRFEIIGTVSFGDGCARSFPGIYGKVAETVTLSWIKNAIQTTGGVICSDPSRITARAGTNIHG